MNSDDFLKTLDVRAQSDQESNDKTAQIDAVKENGNQVTGALKEHTSEITNSIHDLLMATLVSKDPKIAETAKNLADLLKEIKNATIHIQGTNFKPLADNLATLQASLDAVPRQIANAHRATDPTPLLSDIHTTLKNKNWSPAISVTSRVDTSSIQRVLRDHFDQTNSELDLDSYRAQDLDEMEQGVQYVGFVNPTGAWYIIKNVEAENTLRYAFGTDSYDTFWSQASRLQYSRLDKALHETPA